MIENYGGGQPYGHNNPQMVNKDDVNSYTLKDFGLTVDNVKANHFGVDVTDPRTGKYLPDEFYQSKIEAAVASTEKELDIVILPRMVTEHHDFQRNTFNSHNYMHVYQKPIVQVENVRIEYGSRAVFNYPARWWRVYPLEGHIQMLPTMLMSGDGSGNLNLAQVYSGNPVMMGLSNVVDQQTAPQLFHIEYIAGMLPPERAGVTQPYELHPDLWQVIIKKAIIEVFEQWGRLILGPGIAGKTTDMDGIRQSIDTTQSAMYGAASADIVQLQDDIARLMRGLKSYYGINLGLI